MTFLAPLFLWALPLITAPVLVHLFFKVRKRPLPFSSLMFFLRIEPNLQARRKLREIMLLALRVLLLLFAILALARPVLPAIGGGGRTALALVIDNSGSMGANGADGRPLLTAAVARASALIGELRPGDQAALVLTVADLAVAAAGLMSDRAALRAALDQVSVTEASGDPALALRRALALLSNSTTPGREVQVFTDLQAGEWDRETSNSLAAPAGTRVVVHRLAPAALAGADVGLRAVEPPSLRVVVGRPARTGLILANPTATAATVQVRVSDDRGDDSVRTVTVAANGEANLPVLLTPASAGFHWAMARLEGDAFSADDRAGLGLWCGERAGVLLAGRRESFGLLPVALAPDSTGAISGLVPTVVPLAGFDTARRTSKPLMVVITWDAIATLTGIDRDLTGLRTFVADGGTLLVLPPVEGLAQAVDAPAWFGATVHREERLRPASAALVLASAAPCWNDLRAASGAVDVHGLLIARCVPLKPATGARALLGLADGRAVLVENPVGAGWVYACGLAFHPSWSNLPLKGWSLALVQSLALPARAETSRIVRLTAGQGLPAAPGDVAPLRIRSLAGGPLDWRGKREQAPVFPRAGVYALEGDDPAQTTYAVVASSAAEGVRRFADGNRVPVLGSLSHRVAEFADERAVVEDWRRSRRGVDLYPWFVVLAILAFIAEGWLVSTPGSGASGRREADA
jgi:hypothetical protein